MACDGNINKESITLDCSGDLKRSFIVDMFTVHAFAKAESKKFYLLK
ncbi:hypothetical protein JCM19275_3709 [Nonlabens ulvanivorans]|uniref:Uncharacterized protein n=1 Tax=Nonlabens ulvanivorans TaxID=906888 RepID=A0A081DGA6_NONUL|nr:hypothetical protein JCM19296_3561 [Nonlabens ulvanivorans]GAL76995.1 hypothetical protein JCM19275_3709 [Nonlabens ulvanivorans]